MGQVQVGLPGSLLTLQPAGAFLNGIEVPSKLRFHFAGCGIVVSGRQKLVVASSSLLSQGRLGQLVGPHVERAEFSLPPVLSNDHDRTFHPIKIDKRNLFE